MISEDEFDEDTGSRGTEGSERDADKNTSVLRGGKHSFRRIKITKLHRQMKEK